MVAHLAAVCSFSVLAVECRRARHLARGLGRGAKKGMKKEPKGRKQLQKLRSKLESKERPDDPGQPRTSSVSL